MSTHNICFHGQIRKISVLFGLELCCLSEEAVNFCWPKSAQQILRRQHITKNNKMSWSPSKDSDQPGHPPSLIRVFAVCSMVAKDPSILHTDSEESDQTGHMLRLI